MKRRTFFGRVGALATLGGGVVGARAQQAITKIVVPFAPGAGSDGIARFFASELTKSTGRPFVVENRTGAGGAIGADWVAKAPADGLSLLMISSPFTTVAATGGAPHYDPTQFAPVAIMGQGPLLFVSNAALPGNNLRETVAHIRANPGRYSYGSSGNGGINHLLVELLKYQAGISMVHIPYRGIGGAIADLLAGQIQFMTGSLPALLPHIKDGKLKALAVTSKARSPGEPSIPGMGELGFRNFDVSNYWGFVATPGSPAAIVEPLNNEINRIASLPQGVALLRQYTSEPTPMTPCAIRNFLAADVAQWRNLIKATKLQVS